MYSASASDIVPVILLVLVLFFRLGHFDLKKKPILKLSRR